MSPPLSLGFSFALVFISPVVAAAQAASAPRPGDEYEGVAITPHVSDGTLSPVVVRVRESRTIRSVPAHLFGFNHNWFQGENTTFAGNETEIDPAFARTLTGLPLPLNRMSGTGSQYFRWKQGIGPLAERTPQPPPQGGLAARRLGPVEWIQSLWQIDPSAEFAWVLNMRQETPADHADLARFFSADANDEWGRRRIDAGIKRPVPIRIWELGNELDWGEFRADFPLERYIETCRATIAAIREVLPDARFAAHAVTAPWSANAVPLPGGWRTWHRTVLRELGPDLDYIALHPYYLGSPVPEVETYVRKLIDDIREVTGDERIKVFISEHAAWPPRPDDPQRPWNDNWHLTHGLHGCLATGEFLNRLLSHPEVTAATYHNFSAGPWGVFYRDGRTRQLYHTGIYDLYRLYGEASGRDVVTAEPSGDRTDVHHSDLTFTTTAMTVDAGLHLVVVNREPSTKRETSFAFEQSYDLTEIVTLSGETPASHNTVDHRGIAVTREALQPASAAFHHFAVPAKSICLLKLRRR